MNEPQTYEPAGAARFRIETDVDGGSQVVIPARRNLFVLLFLLVWLTGWSVGGFTAIATLWSGPTDRVAAASGDPTAFLALWSVAWLFGVVAVTVTLLWMIAGREVIKPHGGDLESRVDLLGFRRRRIYRGSDIRGLAACPFYQPQSYSSRQRISVPLYNFNSSGAVKFSYGDRTRYLGDALDEAEGEKIVAFLRQRLPKSAFAEPRA